MNDCPMGIICVGCEYAKNCARPKVQARKLRDAVERLNLEYGAERKSGLAMLDRLIAANAEVERLKREAHDARRAAMEEAAQVAERESAKHRCDSMDDGRGNYSDLAAQIRARYETALTIAAAIRAAREG